MRVCGTLVNKPTDHLTLPVTYQHIYLTNLCLISYHEGITPLILKLNTSGILATLSPWTGFLVLSKQEVGWLPEPAWML
jgi:hypothetical protein